MAINNIQSNLSNSVNIHQQYSDRFKTNKTENQKPTIQPNSNNHLDKIRNLDPSELKDFLSVDEKKVLKEVFGDLAVDKYSNIFYNNTRSIDLLKGSQIDIKL
ncbi:MAG: hypothetical protein RBS16_00965 [Candidatus Cloacimonadales bacterium]|jgi:hypothetical protein|nr:hypothetical protein [Candidatus Cloacimonadota bacterium]MDD2650170.1 hypothetical protein [Candidatus Cloacimonadota bacterium]MDD3501043.1 hypothetical protein [Candidatus Cloacimonadota bacterium]MDX9976583.1 hypothetical protein [Candidatus Cloacimonadales bacterium]